MYIAYTSFALYCHFIIFLKCVLNVKVEVIISVKVSSKKWFFKCRDLMVASIKPNCVAI